MLLTQEDIYLFHEGTHAGLYECLGGRLTPDGAAFATWMPKAHEVHLIGTFNGWKTGQHRLRSDGDGWWRGEFSDIPPGSLYKFHVRSGDHWMAADLPDIFTMDGELPPGNASVLHPRAATWTDQEWMASRRRRDWFAEPVSIYQVHPGSWGAQDHVYEQLGSYVKSMGFTHVEFLATPTGSYAVPPQFGLTSSETLIALIDSLHACGLAVILHYQLPQTEPLESLGWGADQLASLALSGAAVRLSHYHADALRLTGPLAHSVSGRIGAYIQATTPGAYLICDDGCSDAFWWDRDWSRETLRYFFHDPFFRRYHHHSIVSSTHGRERGIIPLSNLESSGGRGSLAGRMPGDEWLKLANLRALYAYAWASPGKKLLFMGSEFGQSEAWTPGVPLEWTLLNSEPHNQLRLLVGTLNHLYRGQPELYESDNDSSWEWVDAQDEENNIIAFARYDRDRNNILLALCNFSPVSRSNYRLGVPEPGQWRELLNTDAAEFGGSGHGNLGGTESVPIPLHGRLQSITITVPPLGALLMGWRRESEP